MSGPQATPLGDIVFRAQALLGTLYGEYWVETRDARWPRAGQPTANIGQHNPSDKTAQTAIHPDPINTQRADRIERTLRRVCRELEDEHAARQRRDVCEHDNCIQRATVNNLCRRHYDRQYKREYRRRSLDSSTKSGIRN